MPAPSPRRRRGHRSAGHLGLARGFTLIEILVVIVIIGIISASIILSMNLTGQDSELQKESDRLFSLFNYTQEQAELQTREYGLLLAPDSYEFVSYDVQRGIWRSVYEDDVLRQRKLPEGLTFKLVVEGRAVVLHPPTDLANKSPQVMIFSDGDLTSFQLTLERDDGTHSVTIMENDQGQVVEKPMVTGAKDT